MSVMAWEKFDVSANAAVIEAVDGEAVYALFETILGTPTTPKSPIAGLAN